MPTKRASWSVPSVTFASVAIVVSNRPRSVAWYTRALGLEILAKSVEQDGHWGVVGRKGETAGLHLCQIAEIDSSFPLESGPTGILLRVPGNFETSCAALKKNGVRFTQPPKQESWGRWAMVADPDGNEIMLVPAPR